MSSTWTQGRKGQGYLNRGGKSHVRDRMEEQNENRRPEKGRADAYQENLPPRDQTDLSSGTGVLSGVPEPIRALLYHFPTHRHHALASRTGRPLWLSLSRSHLPLPCQSAGGKGIHLARCRSLRRIGSRSLP